MNGPSGPYSWIGPALALSLLFVVSAKRAVWEPRRVIFMRRAARQLGMTDRRGDPENLEFISFPFFSSWGTMSTGILHTLSGERGGAQVRLVDYWWKGSMTSDAMCALVALEASMPPTVIYHGSAASDFEMPALRGELVTLELEDFQEQFRVRSEDPRFANAFLDQRMLEFLLEHQEYQFEMAEYGLLIIAPRSKKLEDVRALLEVAEGFRAHVPRVIPGLFPLNDA